MARNGRNRRPLNPDAAGALNNFKVEIAQELGLYNRPDNEESLRKRLEQYKVEIADSLGISSQIKQSGWSSVVSKNCGAVGGRMGGKLGGNMVKKMITMAQEEMSKGLLAPENLKGGETDGKES